MENKTLKITQLKKAKYNPRKITKKELDKLKAGIEKYGVVQSIVVNKDYTIIGGHQRIEACRLLNIKEVPCTILDLKEDDEKELNLALNKIGGSWDDKLLFNLLDGLAEKNRLALTGFEHADLDKLRWKNSNKINKSLIEDYIIPPFSVFDTKQGYWQKLKKDWIEQIGNSGAGREDNLISEGLNTLASRSGADSLSGTSIFDPVLCQVCYTWFAEEGGLIIDPFAGGSVRGLVASILGYKYTGTDVSKKQIVENIKHAKKLDQKGIKWENDDGLNLNKYVKKGEADLMFTCPPYYDLEVYDKDNKDDISNSNSYTEFLSFYKKILGNTYDLVKDGGFAIVTVGNVRDKAGNYQNLVGDTIKIMEDAGYKFYNEIILATAIATASVRARKTFDANKKVVKTHQNILFFSKGKEISINKNLKTLLESGQTATAHHDVLVFKK